MAAVRLDKSDWDAFLTKFSELSKKYELILRELDLTQTRIKELSEKTNQQRSKNGEALRKVTEAVGKLCDETERFLNDSKRER